MTRGRAAYAALLCLTLAVYVVIVGWSLPRIATGAGGLMPFDLRPGGYSFDAARTFLGALDRQTTDFYLDVQQRIDTVYPALLALTLATGIWALTRRAPLWLRLAAVVLCVLGAGFDWLENLRVAALLRAGPEAVTQQMVAAASRATVLKSAASALAMTALLAALVLCGWRNIRRRTNG